MIGHRGASGYRPEHTLASYQLAIEMGADFIEPDLVSTKDGVLVARHENEIGATTDVATRPEFASRKTTRTVDGAQITGWFTEDFTLAELKTLRARERIPAVRPANATYDGLFEIPTLQEVLDLTKNAGTMRRGRHSLPPRGGGLARGGVPYSGHIGVYPETKHPSYFRGIGLPLEPPLVETLDRNGYRDRNAPIFIQSFEVGNLRRLRTMTDLPLIQLINETGKPRDFFLSGDPRTYADLANPAGLREIAEYAQGIGPDKNLIVPRDGAENLLAPTSLVNDAHAAGLVVHAWTFRRENMFLPTNFCVGSDALQPGNLTGELQLFYGLGLDGVFTDNPDIAVQAR